MLYKFFRTQNNNRTSKDWITAVLKDLDDIKFNVKFEEIEIMKKTEYLRTVNTKSDQKAMENLSMMKSNLNILP